MLPLPGVPGMEAAGTRARRRRRRQRPAARRPRRLPLARSPAPTAACARVPADWVVRLPAAVEDDDRRRAAAQGPDRRLPAARPRPRAAPARACWCMRRPAASACCVCAWARRLGATVIGTVSSEEKARVAREHGCEHVIVTRDYRFADAVQRLAGGADVIVDGLGDAARDENLAALAPLRPLDQPGPGERRARADLARPAGAASRSPSRGRSCSTTSPRRAQLAERAQRVWDGAGRRHAEGAADRALSLDAAAQAHARLESRAHASARWSCCLTLRPRSRR